MAALDRRTLLLALALAFAGGGRALADDDGDHDDRDDHDLARRALEEGDVRPLAEILAEVGGRIDGDLVGVEFDRINGRYVYELKVITPSGRLREISVDAQTAEILGDEAED
jgi:uncharacterized membrane protein YkoI